MYAFSFPQDRPFSGGLPFPGGDGEKTGSPVPIRMSRMEYSSSISHYVEYYTLHFMELQDVHAGIRAPRPRMRHAPQGKRHFIQIRNCFTVYFAFSLNFIVFFEPIAPV